MSLAALLLGLPGKIHRLRAFNPPKIPLHLPFAVESYGRDSSNTYDAVCPLRSAELTQPGTNNSVVASHEVINLSGKGAVNGVWVTSQGNYILGTVLQRWGLEIILDGTDITPPGWVHTMSRTFVTYQYDFCLTSPAIGGVQSNVTAQETVRTHTHVMVPASVPIPFDSSLVVNLIHLESNSASAGYENTCWVNAWLTE